MSYEKKVPRLAKVLAFSALLIVISPAFADEQSDKIHAEAVAQLVTSQPKNMTEDEYTDKILDSIPPPVVKLSNNIAENRKEKTGKIAAKVLKATCLGAARFCNGMSGAYSQPARYSSYSQPTFAQPQQQLQPLPMYAPPPRTTNFHSFSSTKIGDTVYTTQWY